MIKERKYKNGDRVKVKHGHVIYSSHRNDQMGIFVGEHNKGFLYDINPELKEDTATVQYTYAEKYWGPETCSYGLKFDKYGEVAWFEEENLIPAN